MGVRRTLALRKHVLNADRLQNGTHGTSGYDTRTGGGRTYHHQRAAEAHLLLVRDRSVDHGNLHQILLCILYALGDEGVELLELACQLNMPEERISVVLTELSDTDYLQIRKEGDDEFCL